jgi:hypothetical protein
MPAPGSTPAANPCGQGPREAPVDTALRGSVHL